MFKRFKRKFKITMHFKSGMIKKFNAEAFKVKSNSNNEITSLEWTNTSVQLLYTNLSEIESITCGEG